MPPFSKPGTPRPPDSSPTPPPPERTQAELAVLYKQRRKGFLDDAITISATLRSQAEKNEGPVALLPGEKLTDPSLKTRMEQLPEVLRARGLIAEANRIKTLLDSKQPLPDIFKSIDLTEALSILGPLLINPSEYKAAYGWDISPSSIPPIPFTRETLEDAKKKGSYLILHIDKDPQTNAPITGQYLRDKVEPILVAQNEGKFISNPNDVFSEPFYTTETPRAGWVLVDKGILKDSTSINYTQQTKLLREYVKTLKDLTPQEQTAIDQCTDAELARLGALVTNANTWKQAVGELANLQLNQLFRNRACETLQTIATIFLTRNGARHLEDKWDWGISTWASGRLASVGYFNSGGAYLHDWSPGNWGDKTGVVPSRRAS